MRPLTEEETRTVFEKIANYTGSSLKNLIAPLPNGDRFVLRVQKDRVYYVLLSIANLATSIARDKLLSIGTCLGERNPTLHSEGTHFSYSSANTGVFYPPYY